MASRTKTGAEGESLNIIDICFSGKAVLLLIILATTKFKALVCHDGVFHLPSFLLECDEPIGLHEDFKGVPYIWKNPNEVEKWSPAQADLMKKWKTPMLIVHSDLDYRVPVTEGIAAFNTCQALGIESRFINFPDENHFVLKEENSLQWHRQVFAWLNKFSGAGADISKLD